MSWGCAVPSCKAYMSDPGYMLMNVDSFIDHEPGFNPWTTAGWELKVPPLCSSLCHHQGMIIVSLSFNPLTTAGWELKVPPPSSSLCHHQGYMLMNVDSFIDQEPGFNPLCAECEYTRTQDHATCYQLREFSHLHGLHNCRSNAAAMLGKFY